MVSMILRIALSVLLSTACAAAAQETVAFSSVDADLTDGRPTALTGLLFKPSGDGPFPALVALHGCSGLYGRRGSLMEREAAWAETFVARGYVVLFPDSFRPRAVTNGCADGAPGARPWAERPRDLYGALLFLQAQPFVIAERIGLIGWSHGGGSVVFAIQTDNTARPAALPKGDFRAAVAFYPALCNSRHLGITWTTAVPFLLEVGAADDWTPAQPCVDIVERAIGRGVPIEIKVYPGAYHDFDWPGRELRTMTPRAGVTVHVGVDAAARQDALQRVPEFFDRYLKE